MEMRRRNGLYQGKWPFEYLLSIHSHAERSELGGKQTTSKIVRSFIVFFLSWILVLDKLEIQCFHLWLCSYFSWPVRRV